MSTSIPPMAATAALQQPTSNRENSVASNILEAKVSERLEKILKVRNSDIQLAFFKNFHVTVGGSKISSRSDEDKKNLDISNSLNRCAALFTPNKEVEGEINKILDRNCIAGSLFMYNAMLIYSNHSLRKSHKIEEADDIEKSILKVRGMLFPGKRTIKTKKKNWPTNKILFGAFLIYLNFPQSKKNINPFENLDLEKFLNLCKSVYRQRFDLKPNEMNCVKLQTIAASIYFLYEFGLLKEEELSVIDLDLNRLYLDRVTSEQLDITLEKFNTFYSCEVKNKKPLFLLKKLLSGWLLTKNTYYRFQSSCPASRDLPLLTPNQQLFFKSNAFWGFAYNFLNNKKEESNAEMYECFKTHLKNFLEIYLEFSCLDVFLKYKGPQGSTISISELKKMSQDQLFKIELSRVESDYYKAILKVILHISFDIHISDDTRKKIYDWAELANIPVGRQIGGLKQQTLGALSNSVLNEPTFAVCKELEVCSNFLELKSLLILPDPKIEAKAVALLEKIQAEDLISKNSEMTKKFLNSGYLYEVMLALRFWTQSGTNQTNRSLYVDKNIFNGAIELFQKIEDILSNQIEPLPLMPVTDKHLWGVFLVYLEIHMLNVLKVLKKEINLDDFLEDCASIYLNGFNVELNKQSHRDVLTMGAAIYFLCKYNKLQSADLSPLEKSLRDMIGTNYSYNELTKMLIDYRKEFHPIDFNKGKAQLRDLNTVGSFWEEKERNQEEDKQKVDKLLFIRTNDFFKSLYGFLNAKQGISISVLSRIKLGLSMLLKIYIKNSNLDKFLGPKEDNSPATISLDKLKSLSNNALENINLEDIEKRYFVEVIETLINLSKHAKLDSDTEEKLLDLKTKSGIV